MFKILKHLFLFVFISLTAVACDDHDHDHDAEGHTDAEGFVLENNGTVVYRQFEGEVTVDNLSLSIHTDYVEDIIFSYVSIDENDNIDITELPYQNNSIDLDISSDYDNVIIANSNYNGIESIDASFSISINESNINGDINGDLLINVQDVILAINLVLIDEYNIVADLNSDNTINILDIVELINLILD